MRSALKCERSSSIRVMLVVTALVLCAQTDGAVWYVRADANGANNGSSWTDAFVSLQSALAVAQGGDEIRVAAGTYKPAPPGGLQSATFQLISGAQVLGGYAGTGPDPDARDPEVNLTILSGDINGTDVGNSFHVVTGSGVDNTALLSGFTITRGVADQVSPHNRGGGVFIQTGSPRIENCRIINNETMSGSGFAGPGAGFYCNGGAPTLTDCVLSGNRTGTGVEGGPGAGAYLTGAATVTMTRCTINDNHTGSGGAAVGGGKGGDGGGIYLLLFSSLTLNDCVVQNNSAGRGGSSSTAPGNGGGIFCFSSTLVLTNCQITGNRLQNAQQSAASHGGGIWCGFDSTLMLFGCSLQNNLTGHGGSTTTLEASGGNGAGIYLESAAASIFESAFSTNHTGSGGAGFPAGGYGGSGAGVFCRESTLALTGCSFSGNATGGGGSTGQSGGTGGSGAGLHARTNSTLQIVACVFDANLTGAGGWGFEGGPGSGGYGAAVAVESGTNLLVEHCTFFANRTGNGGSASFFGGSGGSGGGIGAIGAASCVVVNSRFAENGTGNGASVRLGGSGGSGGGIASQSTPTTIVNCEFIGNTTGHGGNSSGGPPNPGGNGGAGAGAFSSGSSPTVANCTFWENSTGAGGSGTPIGATGPGGGVSASGGTVRNSVAWGNLPNQVAGAIAVTYSDVQGGLAGTGNIDMDPMFADAPADDLRLSAGSPCIDAGDNAGVPADLLDLDGDGNTAEATPIDLAGVPRFHDDLGTADSGAGTPPIVDMGAFEYQLTSGCPADLDGDGSIGLADLAILLSNFGAAGAAPGSGDLDGDGDVDLADLATLLSQFGATCS